MSDRALSSGISIPQWMRGKPVSGFDPSTLSPPTYDDDFFQIRFNTATKVEDPSPASGYRALGDVLAEQESRKTAVRPHGVDDGFHGLRSECASSVVNLAQRMLRTQPPHQRQRRNSKSLPASPLGSPETKRRIANRFFTLEESSDAGGSTSSILDALSREPKIRARSALPETKPPPDIRRPQPSEYREMNFWSPTSM